MAERRYRTVLASEHVEDMLDEALMQTFPASDPVTLKSCVERAGEHRGRAAAANRAHTPAATCDTVPRKTGSNDGRAAPRKRGAPRRVARGAR